MLEVLTGTGLATAAGLNAYIPLLVIGALSRWTDLITPPAGWEWLANGWVLVVLAVLLVLEVVADKIPGVDTVNDVVQTVVRPAAGGIAFGAGSSSQTAVVTDPGARSSSPASGSRLSSGSSWPSSCTARRQPHDLPSTWRHSASQRPW